MGNSPASRAADTMRVTNANRLRRLLVLASIFALAGIGLWAVIGTNELKDHILALYLTIGPAAVYWFGYLHCLPDVLGVPVSDKEGTLLRRWSDFARLTAAFAASLWIIWSVASLVHSGLLASPQGGLAGILKDLFTRLTVALVPPFLMFAGVAASEQYLACTMTQGNPAGSGGWRAALRRLVGRLGYVAVGLLRVKRALSLGSALVLVSLLLNITLMGSCGGDPRKGYEIITGRAVWITAQQAGRSETMKLIVAQLGRWTYVLGLAVAVTCLAAVLAGRHGDRLRKSKAMVIITGVLALYGACDFTFGWARTLDFPEAVVFVIFASACILAPTLWVWRARQPRQWNQTRLAIMIALLPVMFFTFAFGVFTAFPDLHGLGSFLFGMLMLWWGLVQSRWAG